MLKSARAQAKAGDLVGAVVDYQAHLEAQPNDTAAAAELKKLEDSPAYQRQAKDPRYPPNFRGRPRDEKTVQLMFELLSPLGAGPDLSFYANRHHNFGAGYISYGSTTGSFYSFHPRYRYYRGRTHWDSFFELGGVFWGASSPASHSRQTADFKGFDLGYGVNVINRGNWTMQFMLSLTVGGVTQVMPYLRSTMVSGPGPSWSYTETRGSDTRDYFIAYPLIGWGYGLVF